MKKIILCFALTLITSGFCFGQDNVVYKTAIKKMMLVSGSENIYKAVINQMITMMKQQKPEVPKEFWDTMAEEMVKSSITDLTDMLAPVYQKHLTLADIQELIAFYESPVGKKFAEKTPLITQESMQVGQQWGMKIGQKIVEKIKEKYN